LLETLDYKDMEGLIVISFFIRDEQAAKDLMAWFEKGYDFILDADRSPGEIKPNRYLVYVEIRRRSTAGLNVEELLKDLNTLTEFQPKDWTFVYKDESKPFSVETFEKTVPLSPKNYRKTHDEDLNEVRVAAGLPAKAIYERDEDMLALQTAAGIK